MDCERIKTITDEVVDCLKEDKSPQKTFDILHDLFELPTIASTKIDNYFQLIHDSSPIPPDYFDDDNFKLAKEITEVLEQHKSGISKTALYFSAFKFIDSRYALAILSGCCAQGFYFLDTFYGIPRKLKCGFSLDEIGYYKVEFIDFNHLLFCKYLHEHEGDRYSVCLLEIDFNRQLCEVLSKQEFSFENFLQLVVDVHDRTRFFIKFHDNESECFLRMGRANGTELIFEHEAVRFDETLTFERLDGDKIQLLWTSVNIGDNFSGNKMTEFMEYTLARDQSALHPRKNVECCQWSGNTCFMAGNKITYQNSAILMLNTETRQVTKIPICFYGYIKDFKFDQDGILSVCMSSYLNVGTLTVHRYPMRSPDTLTNLSFFKLRRTHNTSFVDKLISRAYPQLRPFADYPCFQREPINSE